MDPCRNLAEDRDATVKSTNVPKRNPSDPVVSEIMNVPWIDAVILNVWSVRGISIVDVKNTAAICTTLSYQMSVFQRNIQVAVTGTSNALGIVYGSVVVRKETF